MNTFTVKSCEKITPSTLLLTLQRDESERPLAFQPGQYAAISYEKRGIDVTGPFGGFVLDATRDKKAVFMAGGIGITPFISMLRYLSALRADNEVTLLYSCATQDDVPFAEELLSIQTEHPNLKVIFVVGKGPTDKLPQGQVATGFIAPELLDKVTAKNYTDRRFFICGPPVFMKAMSGTLLKHGAPKANVLTEAFTQSSPKQTSILRSWPANAYVLGAIGLVFGTFVVMVGDLLRVLPPTTALKPTKSSPYLITNARQTQLDQLVNSIPPSADVITAPTDNQMPSSASSTSSTYNPQPQSAPTTIYAAPITMPAPACQTTPSGRCL
ncbi:hypothetical protein HJC99_06105 [Candidatus Saccharibacteria bacterium]|nr:hypothetical protein [Candidatus Saccharibacteria bacterium]